MENLSAVAFAIRKALSIHGIVLSIGHVQQLTAAALGYNNLAAYQASEDDGSLSEALDVVLDTNGLQARAIELGHDASEFTPEFAAVLRAYVPGIQIHSDYESWLTTVQNYFEFAIVDDDAVGSEVAMTNGTFPRTDVALSSWEEFDKNDRDSLTHTFQGLVIVDQDADRAFYGNEIEVQAILTVERLGCRLFGRRTVEVEYAGLRWVGEPSGRF